MIIKYQTKQMMGNLTTNRAKERIQSTEFCICDRNYRKISHNFREFH